MNEPQKAFLTNLYETYDDSPVLKGLIQTLSIFGIPVGPVIDSSLGTYVNKIKTDRFKIFFDELNRGDIILTQEQIESNDFMNAYFETSLYILRTKSDDKIKRFAKILKNVYSGNLTFYDFDDYSSIFNDLTDREFAILLIKLKYEQEFHKNSVPKDKIKFISSYWSDFKLEVISTLNIQIDEFNPMLVRLERSGCYSRLNGSYLWLDDEEYGNTTELFKTIYTLIND
jgi:hypothetical protein